MMKKLLAIALACSVMMISAVSCSDKEKNKESSAAETESYVSDEAAQASENPVEDAPASLEEGQTDPELIGQWYSEEMGGSFCFSEDNTVSLAMDYSGIMYFNSDKQLVLPDNPEKPLTEFDGGKITVTFAESDDVSGLDMSEFMVLERKGEADAASLDGEYFLVGGALYDDMNNTLFEGKADSKLSMIADGEKLWLKMDICRYAADGEKLEMYGEGSELFSITTQEEAVCDYSIDGDTFTMTDSSGVSMDYVRQ